MADFNPQIIRSSFEHVKPIAQEVIDLFYENLWRDYPASRTLFGRTDMDRQKKLLIKSLVFIVDNLLSTDRLMAYLKDMGARHIHYGTEDEHYDWVGASLLKTLQTRLRDVWTPELTDQWGQAYGIIASTMKQGAREALQRQAPAKTTENVVPMRATDTSSLSFELPESLKAAIQDEARAYAKQVIEREFQKAVEKEIETWFQQRSLIRNRKLG